MKIVLPERVKKLRTSGVMYGYNLALDDVLSTAVEITLDELAEVIWKVSRDQAILSMMVKPWAETKKEVKDFYRKQAQAILKFLEGKGGRK